MNQVMLLFNARYSLFSYQFNLAVIELEKLVESDKNQKIYAIFFVIDDFRNNWLRKPVCL